MEKEEIKKEVSDWFYKKHYYCKDVDSMLTFTAQSVIDEIVEFTTQIVKNNGVLDDVIKSVCYKECGNTQPSGGSDNICLNCGSSIKQTVL